MPPEQHAINIPSLFNMASDPLPEHIVLRNLDRELATPGIDVDASPYPGKKKKKKTRSPRQQKKRGVKRTGPEDDVNLHTGYTRGVPSARYT